LGTAALAVRAVDLEHPGILADPTRAVRLTFGKAARGARRIMNQ
jgi:hypothetical protein